MHGKHAYMHACILIPNESSVKYSDCVNLIYSKSCKGRGVATNENMFIYSIKSKKITSLVSNNIKMITSITGSWLSLNLFNTHTHTHRNQKERHTMNNNVLIGRKEKDIGFCLLTCTCYSNIHAWMQRENLEFVSRDGKSL